MLTDAGYNILVECNSECSYCLSVQPSSQQLRLSSLLYWVKETTCETTLLWTRLHIILTSSTLLGIKVLNFIIPEPQRLQSASALNPYTSLPTTFLPYYTDQEHSSKFSLLTSVFNDTFSRISLPLLNWPCCRNRFTKCHIERPLAQTSLFQLCTAIMK